MTCSSFSRCTGSLMLHLCQLICASKRHQNSGGVKARSERGARHPGDRGACVLPKRLRLSPRAVGRRVYRVPVRAASARWTRARLEHRRRARREVHERSSASNRLETCLGQAALRCRAASLGPVRGAVSSPLHLLLIAGGLRLGMSLWLSTLAIGVGATLATATALVYVLRQHLGRVQVLSAAAVALYLIDVPTAIHATSGLETPLLVAVLAVACAATLGFADAQRAGVWIGDALGQSGLGTRGRIICDAAGAIPNLSGFHAHRPHRAHGQSPVGTRAPDGRATRGMSRAFR